MISQHIEEVEMTQLLHELLNLMSSSSWSARHGSVFTISSILRHNPSAICSSTMFPSILNHLKVTLKDEKVFQLWCRCMQISRFLTPSNCWQIPMSQTVPPSWHVNEGIWKASTSSSSEWSIEHLNTFGYYFMPCVSFAWWFQWS